MPRRPRILPINAIEDVCREIDAKLKAFSVEMTSLSLREKVLKLVGINHSMRDLGVSVAAADGLTARAARDRIEAYLKMHVGQEIEGEELAVVSGISEYARRVRELRKEKGYKIISGASNDEDSGVSLKTDQYILLSAERDLDAARRWHIANRIRREDKSQQAKLIEFFQENVGRIVTTEELSYVAKCKGGEAFTRRIRQLRTEGGYPIATRLTGRPDLAIGEYVLMSNERVRDEHNRNISADVEKAVYSRDGNRCRLDGWNQEKWTSEDPRWLVLHHIKPHAEGGGNEADNLVVLCNRCHVEVHAGRLKLPPDILS